MAELDFGFGVDESVEALENNFTTDAGISINYEDATNKPKINGHELIGDKTSADLDIIDKSVSNLDNYYTETEINTLLSGKQDDLTAGSNIVLNGATISAVVPTKTSDLTNDSNFVNASDLSTALLSKQDVTSNSLVTVDKTIVGGINEVHQDVIDETNARIEADQYILDSIKNTTRTNSYFTSSSGLTTIKPSGAGVLLNAIPSNLGTTETVLWDFTDIIPAGFYLDKDNTYEGQFLLRNLMANKSYLLRVEVFAVDTVTSDVTMVINRTIPTISGVTTFDYYGSSISEQLENITFVNEQVRHIKIYGRVATGLDGQISALVDTPQAYFTRVERCGVVSAGSVETIIDGVVKTQQKLNEEISTNIVDLTEAVDLKQDKIDNGLATSDKTVVGAINELDEEKSNKPIETTLILDTPIWAIQPTISGSLDPSFLLWNADYYYVTLKDTAGVALSANQFKLTATFGGFATAINQIFTLTGLDTGNSGILVENMNVDFKEIGTTWKLRTAGVPEITLVSNPILDRLYEFDCDLMSLGVRYTYADTVVFRPTLQRIGGEGKYYDMGYYNAYTTATSILMQLDNADLSGVSNTTKYKRFKLNYSLIYSAREIKVMGNGNLSADLANSSKVASSVLYGGVKTDGEDLTVLTDISLRSTYYGNQGRMFRNGSKIIIKEYIDG